MEDSIFSKIVKGEIPSHKVYEDSLVLAFLDIYPAIEGHTLVISKLQVESVWDLPSEDYHALMEAVKKVAARLKDIMGTKYVGIKVEGVDVPHAHIKLYPFNTVEEYNAPQDLTAVPNHDSLAKLADKLKF